MERTVPSLPTVASGFGARLLHCDQCCAASTEASLSSALHTSYASLMVNWNKTLSERLVSLFNDETADPHKVARNDTDIVLANDQDPTSGNHYFDGINAKRFAANYKTQATAYLKNKEKNGFGAAVRANRNDNMGIAERKYIT
jgi:hypothetical protein